MNRHYENRLNAHPDCRDPDHPGCSSCDEDHPDYEWESDFDITDDVSVHIDFTQETASCSIGGDWEMPTEDAEGFIDSLRNVFQLTEGGDSSLASCLEGVYKAGQDSKKGQIDSLKRNVEYYKKESSQASQRAREKARELNEIRQLLKDNNIDVSTLGESE